MKTLSVGIGCRLHSPAVQIEAAVRAALGTRGFDEILTVASVDNKAHEPGLLEFCAHHALPLTFFSAEQLAAIHVDEPSAAARKQLGVDGVCEPCALLAAATAAESAAPRARLLVRKTILAGVTVAIASSHAHHHTQQQDLP